MTDIDAATLMRWADELERRDPLRDIVPDPIVNEIRQRAVEAMEADNKASREECSRIMFDAETKVTR